MKTLKYQITRRTATWLAVVLLGLATIGCLPQATPSSLSEGTPTEAATLSPEPPVPTQQAEEPGPEDESPEAIDEATVQVPEACLLPGNGTYVNRAHGYCFAFPSQVTLETDAFGNPTAYGPPLDSTVEPARARLSVEVVRAAAGDSLEALVDDYLAQFAEMNLPPFTRTEVVLDGVPALMVESVPGRESSRDLFLLHGGLLYHLMLMPPVRDVPEAEAGVEVLFVTAVSSFRLMAPAADDQNQAMPPVSDDLTYTRVEVTEASLRLEIPAGWIRPGPEWEWMPSEGGPVALGITWIDLVPPQEAEAALLPQPAQILESEPITLTWGQGRLFTVEVYAPASEGKASATMQSVEMHAIIVVPENGRQRAFDLYTSAPDHTALAAQEAVFMRMLSNTEK